MTHAIVTNVHYIGQPATQRLIALATSHEDAQLAIEGLRRRYVVPLYIRELTTKEIRDINAAVYRLNY